MKSTSAFEFHPEATIFRSELSAGSESTISPACAARTENAGWPWHLAYQYLLLEKSPSRRCIIACQKLPAGEWSDWLMVWDSLRPSCQSHRPASMALAKSPEATGMLIN